MPRKSTRAARFLSSRCGSSGAGSGAGGSANASPSHAPFLVNATVPAGGQYQKGQKHCLSRCSIATTPPVTYTKSHKKAARLKYSVFEPMKPVREALIERG